MILNNMITILISRANLRRLALVVASLLVLAACGNEDPEAGSGLTVVATTSIWGDVVAEIVGDDATVEVLIPTGADAHDYQATPRQVASMTDADLVIANGLGLEGGLQDVIATAIGEGAVVYEVAPDLDPIPFGEHHDGEHSHNEEAADDSGAGLDPHVWFDPTRVATAATLISERLAEIEPSVDWQARASTYAEQLGDVDEQMRTTLAAIPEGDRKLVTNHDALGYLADRYGYKVIGVVIPGGSTLSEPSSAELAALVAEVEEEQVRAIFAETGLSSDVAEAVAAEVGYDVEVITLYTGSLGESGSGAEHLTGMLITDANLIAGGLS